MVSNKREWLSTLVAINAAGGTMPSNCSFNVYDKMFSVWFDNTVVMLYLFFCHTYVAYSTSPHTQ